MARRTANRHRGTWRAVIAMHGPRIIVCHACRSYTGMPPLDVSFDPCPFVCARCGTRGAIRDAAEAPAGYAHEARVTGRAFVPPKLRLEADPMTAVAAG